MTQGMRRGHIIPSVTFREGRMDADVVCNECGHEFTVWMGRSVVQCPKCGKVFP